MHENNENNWRKKKQGRNYFQLRRGRMPKITSRLNDKIIHPFFSLGHASLSERFKVSDSGRNHYYRCGEIIRHREMMIRVVRARSDVGHQIPPAASPPPRCSSLPPLLHSSRSPLLLPSVPPALCASPRKVACWRSVVLALASCSFWLQIWRKNRRHSPLPYNDYFAMMFKRLSRSVGCCIVTSSQGFGSVLWMSSPAVFSCWCNA